MTPPPPRNAAAHSPAYVAPTGRCPAISTGGTPGGQGIGGTAGLYRAADATIMIRIELPMAAADVAARRRVRRSAAAPAVSRPARRGVPVPMALLAEVTAPARRFPVGYAVMAALRTAPDRHRAPLVLTSRDEWQHSTGTGRCPTRGTGIARPMRPGSRAGLPA